jgi:hypothetical protein
MKNAAQKVKSKCPIHALFPVFPLSLSHTHKEVTIPLSPEDTFAA